MVATGATQPRRTFAAFSGYRPRLLTLLVVLVIAALIALSNLSYDTADYRGAFQDKSYGWPLAWHRFVIAVSHYDEQAVGWYLSTGRLAVNVALWLLMLAAEGLGCEWPLRRYQPRFCWSLRTMLGLVGLAAVFFAWLANALDRANIQDRLTGTEAGWRRSCSPHGLERWGPKWLDLLGVDRLRRHIFYAPCQPR